MSTWTKAIEMANTVTFDDRDWLQNSRANAVSQRLDWSGSPQAVASPSLLSCLNASTTFEIPSISGLQKGIFLRVLLELNNFDIQKHSASTHKMVGLLVMMTCLIKILGTKGNEQGEPVMWTPIYIR